MKKYIGVLLALVLVLSLGACAPKKTVDEETPPIVVDPADDNEDDIDDQVVDPTPEGESKEVTLYFSNKEYVITGDESLERILSEKRVVEYGDISLEERIVRELIKGPEDTDKLSTEIPTTVKLIGVEVADGTAFVNFAQEGMYGGSLQEMFTIDQIVTSLTDLNSVDRVQFLIDGKVAESLMGHISIDEPFEGGNE